MKDLEIIITKAPGGYVADLSGLSGSPPTGDGKTRQMAVAALFFRLIAEPSINARLVEATSTGAKLWINGELYQSIYPGKR